MKEPDLHNLFNLESLEPRIMLSGDPLLGAINISAPDEQEDFLRNDQEDPPAEEIFFSQESQISETFPADSEEYQPSNKLEDIFTGLDENDSLIVDGDENSGEIDEINENDSVSAFEESKESFSDSSADSTLNAYEILDTRLSISVYEYFNPGLDPPSTELPKDSIVLDSSASIDNLDETLGVFLNDEIEQYDEISLTSGSQDVRLIPEEPLFSEAPDTLNLFEFETDSAGPSDISLILDGEDLLIIDNFDDVHLTTRSIAGTSEIIIFGANDLDDTLTVDFSGGLFDVPITFHGGDAGFDTLVVEGGTFSSTGFFATGPDSGSLQFDDILIHYTGLEPIDLLGSAQVDFVFNDDVDESNQIRLIDHGTSSDGYLRIDSNGTGGFEEVWFQNPSNSLTINAGTGDDIISIAALDTGFAASLTVNGGDGTDALVNRNGVSGETVTGIETYIDRPLLFIPGFAGTFADDTSSDGLEEWYLNRGISPDKLDLDPLAETYSDLVQSFQNVGYLLGDADTGIPDSGGSVAGATLFTALWDWRVPVFDNLDGTDDGLLTNATAAAIQDSTFDSGLDYLAFWLKQASDAWEAVTGSAPTEVDIVTHSTGGVIARAYLQSYAYTEASTTDLPDVYTLVQVGVPAQGTGAAFGMLQNDFSLKTSSRLFGRIIDIAWGYHQDAGKTILNPDATPFSAASQDAFIGAYVEALIDLQASYEF
ncbi:LEPR-XLL domain-containing protein, partial [Thermodesulfobacteriota bacterium]